MRFVSTTFEGIEDLAAREIEKNGGKIERIERGLILYSGSETLPQKINYFAKKVERVAIVVGEGEIKKERDLRKIIDCSHCEGKKIDVKLEMRNAMFRKKELVNEIKKEGSGEVNVFLWINGEHVIAGLDTTGEGLHHRGYERFKHPASLNPLIASSLLTISGWKREFVDPFCGSGTILIEGYHQFKGVGNEWRFRYEKKKINKNEPEIIGVEINEKYVEGAKLNAKAARAKVRIIQGDSKFLNKYANSNYIITNPPFGLRMSDKKKVFGLYESFANNIEEHFSGAILTMIIPHTKFENYFKIEEKRKIKYGKLEAYIYRFKI